MTLLRKPASSLNDIFVLGLLGQPVSPLRAKQTSPSPWDWYHNSAAVLIKNGHIVAAIEEERLTRLKHSGTFPLNAIKHCLQAEGILIDRVNYIAFGERGGEGDLLDNRINEGAIAEILEESFDLKTSIKKRIRLVEHHVGHLSSAFLPSGFKKSLVLSADGFGDGISGTIAIGEYGCDIVRLHDLPFEKSLGRFYSSVMPFLGYGSCDEYKVMGLASYGNATRVNHIFSDLFELLPEGQFSIHNHSSQSIFDILSTFGAPRRQDGEFSKFHMDIAAGIQLAYETIMLHVLRQYQSVTGLTNICLAGGTAQNSSFNGKLLLSGLFKKIFVQPAAHDAGVPLGAALHVYANETGKIPHVPISYYSGGDLPDELTIEAFLKKWEDVVSYVKVKDIAGHIAAMLAEGKVIGWVQGRSEFGPRALGNRSILADPRPYSMKDTINKKIKSRESYRPFAPAVMFEYAHDYFEFPEAAELDYMTMGTPVKTDKRAILGAVTHVDGSARVQVLRKEKNPLFWHVIDAFRKITGTPVLLNTSFNNNKEPIVESVVDALRCFLTTSLDGLALGYFYVTKRHADIASLAGFRVSLPQHVDLVDEDVVQAFIKFEDESHPISKKLCRFIKDTSPIAEDVVEEAVMLWTLRLIDMRPIHE